MFLFGALLLAFGMSAVSALPDWRLHPSDTGDNNGIFIHLYPALDQLAVGQRLDSLRDRIFIARTGPEKRQAVYDYYTLLHGKSQSGLVKVLMEDYGFTGAHIDQLWIQNSIFLRQLPPSLLSSQTALTAFMQSVSSHPSVARVEANRVVGEIILPAEIYSDRIRSLGSQQFAWGVERVHAPDVWNITRGEGVRIAIIDTGVEFKHQSLIGNYAGRRETLSHDYAWFDPKEFANDKWWCSPGLCYPTECCLEEPFDIIGHGTHVMGTIAGSLESGIGVAPGVTWMAAKGCRDGQCLAYGLLKSAEWVVCPTRIDGTEPRCDLGADIASNSWGSKSGVDDLFEQAVKVWREAGIIPVFANGNTGPSCGTANAPADFHNVIGVGAVDRENQLAKFSSRGPGPIKDPLYSRQKPDVSAPGVKIVSAAKELDQYTTMSGTSMATPHTSGVLALMISAWRKRASQISVESKSRESETNGSDLSYDQLFKLLTDSADREELLKPIGGGGRTVPLPGWPVRKECGSVDHTKWPNTFYGYGMVNALQAVNATLNF